MNNYLKTVIFFILHNETSTVIKKIINNIDIINNSTPLKGLLSH